MTMSNKKAHLTQSKDNRIGVSPSKDLQKQVIKFLKSNNTTTACFILSTDYATLKKVSKGEKVKDFIITRLEQKLAEV